jgi:Flp pilus assembly pilin Flp
MMTQIKNRGSLMLEYSVLIVIVIVALVGMQVYLRRAVCGRWRQSADVFGFGRQYEPGGVTKISKHVK